MLKKCNCFRVVIESINVLNFMTTWINIISIIYSMVSKSTKYVKRRVTGGRRRRVRRRVQNGEGFGDFFKKIGNFVKDNKLISRGLGGLSGLLPGGYGQAANVGSNLAAQLGFNVHDVRRRRRVSRGGSRRILV